MSKLESQIKRLGTNKNPDGVTMSLAIIPSKRIKFNPLNPNIMDEKKMEMLSKNIEVNKYLEPVVVFYDKEAKELLVIDGEHRMRTLAKTQDKVIVTLIEGGISRAQAFSGAYTFNAIRGQLDQKKVAKMIQFGLSTYGEKEVRRIMNLQKYKVDEMLMHSKDTAEMSDEMISDQSKAHLEAITSTQKELSSQPISSMGQMFVVSLQKDDYKLVTDTLKSIDNNINKALVSLCKQYKKKK